MSEPVEQFIHAMVARTGEPVLFRPPDAHFRLHAIPLAWLDNDREGRWTLFVGPDHPEDDDGWEDALAMAFSSVSVCELGLVDGVTLDSVNRRVVCTALGLSLLQVALNRAGSQLALRLWNERA